MICCGEAFRRTPLRVLAMGLAIALVPGVLAVTAAALVLSWREARRARR